MSPLDSSLQPLLQTALIGTGRGQGAPRLEGPLQPFCSSSDGPEAALLSAAAAVTLSARAGQSASRSQLPAIALCPPETQAYFSVRGATLLDSCLAQDRELVTEALAWAAGSGRIAPPHMLPRLLDLGRGSKELRRHIVPILGERGRWLAQLNADWKPVAAPLDADIETSWQTGALPARREALLLQREADPDIAREWVRAALTTDGAKERTQWLETLGVGLSQEDEPLLEGALDDKSKEVRALAISLLKTLPASRLVARAQSELEPVLQWSKASKTLDVVLPPAWNKAWARDGLEENVSPYGQMRSIGARGSWVWQWLARVPLTHWETVWNATPEQILSRAPQEWRELLISAWWEAARLQNNKPWALAVVASLDPAIFRRHFSIHSLSSDLADALALALYEKGEAELSSDAPLAAILRAHPGPWSVPLARRFLQHLHRTLQKDGGGTGGGPFAALRAMLPGLLKGALPTVEQDLKKASEQLERVRALFLLLSNLGGKFPVEMATEAATGWPNDPENMEQWAPYIEKFLSRLQLRADLQSEFQNPTS